MSPPPVRRRKEKKPEQPEGDPFLPPVEEEEDFDELRMELSDLGRRQFDDSRAPLRGFNAARRSEKPR